MMTRIGLTFFHRLTMKAMQKSIQLFQSGKFSGVMRMMAAAPIRPVTAGFRPDITPVNMLLLLNLVSKSIPRI